jgi:hypothetical protein
MQPDVMVGQRVAGAPAEHEAVLYPRRARLSPVRRLPRPDENHAVHPISTQKTTYQVYDLKTERAWPAVYGGTARVQGLLTYRFTQRIPPIVVQQLPGVPTSLLGLPGASRNVVANRAFQASNPAGVLQDIDPLRMPGRPGSLARRCEQRIGCPAIVLSGESDV